jgi:hypothetical protein
VHGRIWAPVGHVSIGSQTQAAFTTGTNSLQVVADVSPSWNELAIISWRMAPAIES